MAERGNNKIFFCFSTFSSRKNIFQAARSHADIYLYYAFHSPLSHTPHLTHTITQLQA